MMIQFEARRDYADDNDAAAAAFLTAAAAYGGWHPTDTQAADLLPAMRAQEAVEAATAAAMDAGWAVRCAAEDSPYPPQAVRAIGAWRLEYGGGRSRAILARAAGEWRVSVAGLCEPPSLYDPEAVAPWSHTGHVPDGMWPAWWAGVVAWHRRLSGWAGAWSPTATKILRWLDDELAKGGDRDSRRVVDLGEDLECEGPDAWTWHPNVVVRASVLDQDQAEDAAAAASYASTLRYVAGA